MTTLAAIDFYWSTWYLPFTSKYLVITACSLLVGVVCGVLGCFVVLRRMALIGDALSHAVLPGVVAAFLLLVAVGINIESTNAAGILMIGALAAGMITSILVGVISRHARTKEDSAIGIVFTALFALGVILISALPRGTHFDLKCFLFGEPLAVSVRDLIMLSIVTTAVLAWVVLLYHPMKLMSFDPQLAAAMGLPVGWLHYLLMAFLSLTVVAGLTTVGVIMVVAMVVTPASTAYQLTNRMSTMLLLSALFGAISAVLGLVLAFVINSPTGPAMVLVAAALFGLAVLLSPSHGVLVGFLRRQGRRQHVGAEDMLKAIYKLSNKGLTATIAAVAAEAGRSRGRVLRLIDHQDVRDLIHRADDRLNLTAAGRARALEMVRAHRLWESYLTDEAGLSPAEVHEAADRLEHAHDLVDEVDATLGYPAKDPHGEEIPRPSPDRPPA
ncbi:MAG: iron chelate uptake ABC transporter family permease subunit [Phycisphaeraceae bacterium]